MALIELHPDVDNYILELDLAAIRERGGVADLVEDGKVVIISDLRLDLDQGVLDELAKSTDAIDDASVRRSLKKLEATAFFEGEPPRRAWLGLRFDVRALPCQVPRPRCWARPIRTRFGSTKRAFPATGRSGRCRASG